MPGRKDIESAESEWLDEKNCCRSPFHKTIEGASWPERFDEADGESHCDELIACTCGAAWWRRGSRWLRLRPTDRRDEKGHLQDVVYAWADTAVIPTWVFKGHVDDLWKDGGAMMMHVSNALLGLQNRSQILERLVAEIAGSLERIAERLPEQFKFTKTGDLG